MSDQTRPEMTTTNRVLDVLRGTRVDAGSVTEVWRAMTMAVGGMMSSEFSNGTMALEVAKERAAEAVFDVAALMTELGDRAFDLEVQIVRADPRRRRASICAHESGHALGAWLLGAEVLLVSVDTDDFGPGQDGITLAGDQIDFLLRFAHRPPEPLRAKAEAAARGTTAVVLLGLYSEGVLFPTRLPTTYGDDHAVANRLTTYFAPEGEDRQWLKAAHSAAEQVARRCRRGLRALAHALDEQGRLRSAQVDSILSSRVKPELAAELRCMMLGVTSAS